MLDPITIRIPQLIKMLSTDLSHHIATESIDEQVKALLPEPIAETRQHVLRMLQLFQEEGRFELSADTIEAMHVGNCAIRGLEVLQGEESVTRCSICLLCAMYYLECAANFRSLPAIPSYVYAVALFTVLIGNAPRLARIISEYLILRSGTGDVSYCWSIACACVEIAHHRILIGLARDDVRSIEKSLSGESRRHIVQHVINPEGLADRLFKTCYDDCSAITMLFRDSLTHPDIGHSR